MWKTFLRADGTDGKNAGIGEKKTGESPLFSPSFFPSSDAA